MAKVNLLFQAVTTDYHAAALKKLLSVPDLERVVVSVAFVREEGIKTVATQLTKLKDVSTFFIGIRNDITSIQAVKLLLGLGIQVFAVDTGSRSTIFHPKVFLVKGASDASAIVGSANLTFNGLHNNIEAGTILQLSLGDKDDRDFVTSTLKLLDNLNRRFPEHVFPIKDAAAAEQLFDDGRLVDEDVEIAPSVKATVRKGERDKLKPMGLVRNGSPTRKRKTIKPKRTATTPAPAATTPAVPAPAILASEFVLIWESKGLTERDLNIPTGGSTNATGSMLWKKGAAVGIDQRHFFRDDVFADLVWKKDVSKPHLERATASFQIIIKGLNYGAFTLKLSHNTDVTSRSYTQKNSMTQVHWGPALSLVAKRDLLGRIMSLYRKDSSPPEFMIEID